jgi:sugar phosphate isomerase/epimerase
VNLPIGLQIYTLRREFEMDPITTLRQVAEIGYQGVELSLPGVGGSLQQLSAETARLGLHWIACHVEEEQLREPLDNLLDGLNEAGCRHLVLSYMEYASLQEILEAAARFNRIGKACRDRGIQFHYHNHSHEFRSYGGRRGLAVLLAETDPSLVKLELDVYWVKRAGVDPAAYLRGLGGRCQLLHLKDVEPGPEAFFCEVGAGILNFESILQAAQEEGVQWLIVEQDECKRPPLECVAESYRNLQILTAQGQPQAQPGPAAAKSDPQR